MKMLHSELSSNVDKSINLFNSDADDSSVSEKVEDYKRVYYKNPYNGTYTIPDFGISRAGVSESSSPDTSEWDIPVGSISSKMPIPLAKLTNIKDDTQMRVVIRKRSENIANLQESVDSEPAYQFFEDDKSWNRKKLDYPELTFSEKKSISNSSFQYKTGSRSSVMSCSNNKSSSGNMWLPHVRSCSVPSLSVTPKKRHKRLTGPVSAFNLGNVRIIRSKGSSTAERFERGSEIDSDLDKVRNSSMSISRISTSTGEYLPWKASSPLTLEKQVIQTDHTTELNASTAVRAIADITAKLKKFLPEKPWIAPPVLHSRRKRSHCWPTDMWSVNSFAPTEHSISDIFDNDIQQEVSSEHEYLKRYKSWDTPRMPYTLQRNEEVPPTPFARLDRKSRPVTRYV